MVPNGEGVFETLKVVDSRPQLLARHLDRLAGAAVRLGLDPPDPAAVQSQVATHLATSPTRLGRMRIIWLATEDGAVLSIESTPTEPPAASTTLMLSDWQVDERGPLTGLKTTAYLDYLIALQVARSSGFDDALLSNSAGDICETTTANVFYVLDGALHTPPLSAGCLPGVAREIVLELCDVVEAAAPIAALAEASEVFITSSLREIQPVSGIDERRFSTRGRVTSEVVAVWRHHLLVEADRELGDGFEMRTQR